MKDNHLTELEQLLDVVFAKISVEFFLKDEVLLLASRPSVV